MDNQNNLNQQSQKGGNGLGVAAMVVGIIAIVGSWIPLINIISVVLGFIALGLAIGGLVVSKSGRPKGTSIAGLVLSIITIVLFFAMYSA